MNTNYSAPTRAGNQFIDWKTSTDPPRSLAGGECDRYFIGWPHFLWSQLQPRLQVKPKRNTDRSWSALVRRDLANRAGRSRCRPMANRHGRWTV